MTAMLVAGLHAYQLLITEYGITGELALAAGISEVRLPALLKPPFDAWPAEYAIATPVLTKISIDADDMNSTPELLKIAKVLLDDLMTGFGSEECTQLDGDGRVRIGSWGRDWWQQIQRWSERVGAEVV